MKPHFRSIGVLALAVAVASPALAGEVKVTIKDGRISLAAQDATAREILAEWARVGQIKVVNPEKLTGGPMTVQFSDVPEERVLASVLRSASGYIAAPRPVGAAGLSRYDRILICPAVASAAPAAGPAAAQRPGEAGQNFQRFRGVTDPDAEEDAGGRPRVAPGAMIRPGVDPNAAGQPPEVTFDYANPAQMRMLSEQAGSAPPMAPPAGQNPYTMSSAPVTPTTTQGPGMASQPGVMPTPQPGANQNLMNPYGMPAGTKPGSVIAPPQEPDRSKYINPPKPPGNPPRS